MTSSVWDNVELVTHAILTSATRMEVIQKLGRSPTSAMYRRLKMFEKTHLVDTTHFTPYHSSQRKLAIGKNRTLSNDEIFVSHSTTSTSVVKRRVLQDQLKEYICTRCGCNGIWNGNSLTLQLEHIDGDHTNNQLDNICFLCPNCHSQTSTFCGRNVEYRNTKKSKSDYIASVKQAAIERNQHLVDLVQKSDIDFSKYGWSNKVANLIQKPPQKVKDWMMRYMKDLYENQCFHNKREKI